MTDNEQIELLWRIRKHTIKFFKKNGIDNTVRVLMKCQGKYQIQFSNGIGGTTFGGWVIRDGSLLFFDKEVNLSDPNVSLKDAAFNAMEERYGGSIVKLSWWRRLFNKDWCINNIAK